MVSTRLLKMPVEGILGLALVAGPLGVQTWQRARTKRKESKHDRLCECPSPAGKQVDAFENSARPTVSETQAIPEPEPKTMTEEAASELRHAADVPVTHGAQRTEEPVDFELWVEADLEASWCLEDECAEARLSPADGTWRDNCSTSTLRRRWDDFEVLSAAKEPAFASKKAEKCRLTTSEAFATLGLDKDVEASELATTFRQLSLKAHPDKAGSTEAFSCLVEAYQVAQSAISQRKMCRTG